MKIKIIISILIILSIFNTVSAIEYGCFEIETTKSTTAYHSYKQPTSITSTNLYFKDPNTVTMNQISIEIPIADWTGSTKTSEWDTDVNFFIGGPSGTQVAHGTVGFSKGSTHYHCLLLFDWWDCTGFGGYQHIGLYNYDTSLISAYQGHNNTPQAGEGVLIYVSTGAVMSGTFNFQTEYNFYNAYNYSYISPNSFVLNVTRNSSFESKINISSNAGYIFNETELEDSNLNYMNFDLSNDTWTISCMDKYNLTDIQVIEFRADVMEPSDKPTIVVTTQPIESGDTINISYTNLEYIRTHAGTYGYDYFAGDTIEIVLYEIQGTGRSPVFNQILTSNEDNSIFLDSSLYNSGKTYGVCITTTVHRYYYGCANTIVETDFIIYSDLSEYINIYEDAFYTCDEVYLYYKSINKSKIELLDNDNNVILSWINKQGEGSIAFNIPMDSNSDNSYPNWKINMTDNDNITNYHNDSFIVYWKICEYPIDEPIEYPTQPDEDIQDNIDELKEGIQPLKELVFGLSTIFIDNPDENNNDIIDTEEIGNFFTGLIPWAIIIFIFIVYKVLGRK